jgi:predicted methyltransferase
VSDSLGPLLTTPVHAALVAARDAGTATIECSLDLERTTATIAVDGEGWSADGRRYPFPDVCKDRTIYHWTGASFEPIARYAGSLIKLVPTEWGAPTFEIDGIKMLPTARVSPFEDAGRKVGLIEPAGKQILDTCGGLGYFAAWCLRGHARHVDSFEKNPDVVWLRSLNPWSPENADAAAAKASLKMTTGDIVEQIAAVPAGAYDAVLHDPPRFGIAGELYSQAFYDELARVLKRRGKLFHYTGTPNKLTTGRDVPNEVATRLRRASFSTERSGDGVLAVKAGNR